MLPLQVTSSTVTLHSMHYCTLMCVTDVHLVNWKSISSHDHQLLSWPSEYFTTILSLHHNCHCLFDSFNCTTQSWDFVQEVFWLCETFWVPCIIVSVILITRNFSRHLQTIFKKLHVMIYASIFVGLVFLWKLWSSNFVDHQVDLKTTA